jgi:hypothetical protein
MLVLSRVVLKRTYCLVLRRTVWMLVIIALVGGVGQVGLEKGLLEVVRFSERLGSLGKAC